MTSAPSHEPHADRPESSPRSPASPAGALPAPAAAPAHAASSGPTGGSRPAAGALHSERLLPSLAGWFGIVAFALVLGVALTVAGPVAAVVTAVVTLVVGCAVAWWTAPVVEVRDGVLRAGGTEIPTSLLADVVTLDREGVREQMGTGWDARAFACLRTWTGGAIRADVVDPADPTPFWVVSTRRPDDLAAAVTAQG